MSSSSSDNTNTSNVLCLYFVQGFCSYGEECRFSHDLKLLENEATLPKQITLYKTELCRTFMELGTCKFGERCQFAHGLDNLKPVKRHKKYKTKKCKRFHEEGVCPFGNRCCFIHGETNIQQNAASTAASSSSSSAASSEVTSPAMEQSSATLASAMTLKKFKLNELEDNHSESALNSNKDSAYALSNDQSSTKKRSISMLAEIVPPKQNNLNRVSLKKSMDEQSFKRSDSLGAIGIGPSSLSLDRMSWDPMMAPPLSTKLSRSSSMWKIEDSTSEIALSRRSGLLSPSLAVHTPLFPVTSTNPIPLSATTASSALTFALTLGGSVNLSKANPHSTTATSAKFWEYSAPTNPPSSSGSSSQSGNSFVSSGPQFGGFPISATPSSGPASSSFYSLWGMRI